ncbi:hypothetical protein [Saccharicrinis fermentans]|uniref:EamA-like transporter family protein n=1 Tax=Saccharicrinis fermentans DSM 9555 = JCM 21142 TaxID=869213 RepID=W7YBQ9_9BACT|nr:hypothetical protein [Saccharicrinis fermentans]GAF01886.1 hypothetical protein JCM21142_506 [Saccharicrinis fermentans DSM 9555 = JCM 21142]
MSKKMFPAIVVFSLLLAQPAMANSVVDVAQSDGISMISIFRGILGMIVLIGIAGFLVVTKRRLTGRLLESDFLFSSCWLFLF